MQTKICFSAWMLGGKARMILHFKMKLDEMLTYWPVFGCLERISGQSPELEKELKHHDYFAEAAFIAQNLFWFYSHFFLIFCLQKTRGLWASWTTFHPDLLICMLLLPPRPKDDADSCVGFWNEGFKAFSLSQFSWHHLLGPLLALSECYHFAYLLTRALTLFCRFSLFEIHFHCGHLKWMHLFSLPGC